MKKQSLIAAIFALLLNIPGIASADARGDLGELVRTIRTQCTPQFCRGNLEIRTVFAGGNGSLPNPVLRTLGTAAKDQAQIWADTILEGDYEAAGDTRLDLVQAIRRGDRLIAYRIQYSETANSPWGRGRIVETAYVHSNLRSVVTDERDPVRFEPLSR